MNDYKLYEESRKTVEFLICDKKEEIKKLESEIFYLKKTKRMLSENEYKCITENKKSDLIG